LLDVTRGALELAVESVTPGLMWSKVAGEIQAFVEAQGFAVVREFVGHGIGRDMHEDPKVPNYWSRRQSGGDFELAPNMVLAIEPMVNLGSHQVGYGDDDRWVVVTKDGKRCAHFEHTVAVTETGADVLTDGR
jgi:methionyl aminopeptidase